MTRAAVVQPVIVLEDEKQFEVNMNAQCKCPNGKCEEKSGKVSCICNPEYALYKELCKECQCGKGANCTFEDGWITWIKATKTCVCPKGFKEENGKCGDPCDSNPCKNAGKCSVIEGKVTCACIDPFIGDKCEKKNCISAADCEFREKCTNDKLCVCKDGYEGETCDIITGCKDLKEKCEGANGTCVFDASVALGARCQCSKRNHVYDPRSQSCKQSCVVASDCGEREQCIYFRGFCECKKGYEGEKCFIVTGCLEMEDKCRKLGAVCVYNESTINKASCKCIAKNHVYDPTSDQCKDLCMPNPCKNGGSCSTIDDRPSCYCQLPFYGSSCESGNPCEENPCQNGGTCVLDALSFKCLCKESFSGVHCETDVKYEGLILKYKDLILKYKDLVLMNAAIISLLVLLLLLTACCFIRLRIAKK